MMQLTNRSLALLLMLAIVISIGGTTISLIRLDRLTYTGYAPAATGTTNVTILSTISISFDVQNINFGTGYINNTGAGMQLCTMVTNGTYNGHNGPNSSDDCVGFNQTINQSNGFIIRNNGNLDVQLNISSNATASTFITGDAGYRAFNWSVKNLDTGACDSEGPFPFNYSAVNTTGAHACSNLNYEPGTNRLTMDILVQIPEDALPGLKEATITALGYS